MAGVSRRPPAYANRCVARKRAPTEHPGANRRRSPLAGDLTGENSSAETRNQLAGRKPVSLCPAWREYGDASGADPIAAKNVIEGIYEKSQILERFAEIGYNTAMNQMGMQEFFFTVITELPISSSKMQSKFLAFSTIQWKSESTSVNQGITLSNVQRVRQPDAKLPPER